MRIIRSWGTEIKSMISSCKDYGIEEPEFLEVGDSFRVNFYRLSFHTKVHQNSPKNLNVIQESILEIISENPAATQVFMSKRLGITSRAVKKVLKT